MPDPSAFEPSVIGETAGVEPKIVLKHVPVEQPCGRMSTDFILDDEEIYGDEPTQVNMPLISNCHENSANSRNSKVFTIAPLSLHVTNIPLS